VFAKSVVILGEVTGNVTACEKVDLRDNGSVDGDIAAPRVAIAEGAHFRGSIDMQRTGSKRRRARRPDAKPRLDPTPDAAAHAAGARAAVRTERFSGSSGDLGSRVRVRTRITNSAAEPRTA
jgi:hypothetical protein